MSRLPASLVAYRLATGLAEPLVPLLLDRRARRGKEDPARLGERLGRAGVARPPGPVAWLHGASVGEALSLLPLIDALAQARPDLTLLVTSGTRTAAELLGRRLPPHAIHQYAPVDGPAATRRFLDFWRPSLGVFVESELWPNLLLQARARGVRLALLSAKLSDASLRNWTRFGEAARALLGAFDLVLAQDERAAGRLASLGIEAAGLADLKFGAAPLPADEAALAALRTEIGERPVILAASTHPGEDALILARFADAMEIPPLAARAPLLVIVPRHPERGAAVASLAADDGLAVSRQGAGEPIGEAQVRVADALGELGLWYRLASLAVIGGSLVDGVGGHNPLEPARLGCAFVSGPLVANWQSAYAGLIDAQATVLVANGALDRWLADGIERAPILPAMAARAAAFVAARDGEARAVAERLLVLIR
ncbi:MAG: glycosyltransferase N-terminal domain-containing protein [Caulobacteraceae bacterium]|nr:glycosyltransferase N-terminal domain-containing protein [Caulobacteraceae bacterium]